MENFVKRKRPSISLSIFATLSESFSSDKWSNSIKSPKRFEGGVVGLGIVAAMTDLNHTHEAFLPANSLAPSLPIPIVSSAKPAANFKGGLNLEKDVVDELSESYTCVISHCGDNRIRKRVYFDDKLNGIVDDCPACMAADDGVFSASPLDIGGGEAGREFRTADFLDSCYLCKKRLHGLDIFMYRGEKAFCSAECRENQIGNEDQKEKCKTEAMKQFDYSVTLCASPMLFFAGVAAA